ncbi:NAD(P)H-binding protein [Salinirubellus salinus]|uniref:NAD(P)H-binding protein n=1 Tax=Salinirubellus salinus TaxID=1364945 RepID=A0A9E7R227_9EURY|nr:NAD(P)H-binding protein [Salinirubellus salinus]UWM54207.1 NAD(P)H-binding protein [Salinirubellus salinus]
MRITVFGATGRTGVPFVRRALDAGHEVVAHARTPSKLPFSDERLVVVEGDVYTGEGVAEAIAGADAVVSLLGQTGDGPDDLLTVAGDHVTGAMAEHGVTRYVTLVGAGVREAGESPSLSGKVMGTLLRLVAKEVLADAEEHVRRVRATDLEWTVVRAPRLVDGDASGYRAGDIDLGFESVARADVAAFCLDCVEDDLHVREMPKVGPA